jgi:hypothetical protein
VRTQRDPHQAFGVNVSAPRSQSEVCGVFRRILMVTVKMTKVDLACDPPLCAESVGKRANRGKPGKALRACHFANLAQFGFGSR